MANAKLERIEKDIAKTRAKIVEYQNRLKDLEARKTEEENAQIVHMVKAVNIDAAQLAAFLSAYQVFVFRRQVEIKSQSVDYRVKTRRYLRKSGTSAFFATFAVKRYKHIRNFGV